MSEALRRLRLAPLRPAPLRLAPLGLLAWALVACDGDGPPSPIEPEPDEPVEVMVLNSTGQTLARFEVGEVIDPLEQPIDLGAGFDGSFVDATETHAVTTVSSFGGSRVLFADLGSGLVTAAGFPDPEGADANPSRAVFDAAGAAWFAGRGSDAIYTAVPGDVTATRVTSDVGTFVEAVLPVGEDLVAIDAFIDDDGGSFAPLGPSRVFILDEIGAVVDEVALPDEARNALGGVVVDGAGLVVVLLGGTFDPATFAPNDDGGLVVVDVEDRDAGPFVPFDANGVAIEAGADGLVYVTTTTDFVDTDVLSFDPVAGSFVAGPAAPIGVADDAGADVECWTATALEDGRLLCVTFDVVEQGRLLLLDDEGSALDEVASGFGSTDLLLR